MYTRLLNSTRRLFLPASGVMAAGFLFNRSKDEERPKKENPLTQPYTQADLAAIEIQENNQKSGQPPKKSNHVTEALQKHIQDKSDQGTLVELFKKVVSPMNELLSNKNKLSDIDQHSPVWESKSSKTWTEVREKQPLIYELLQGAKIMSNAYVVYGVKFPDDLELINSRYKGEVITLDRIEGDLKKALTLASEPSLMQKYPSIYGNILSCLAEFYLDVKRDYQSAKFFYQKLNQHILLVLKYPINNNASLETGFKCAQCYLKLQEYKEFTEILAYIEATIHKNLNDLETMEVFSKEITKKLVADPKSVDYFKSSDCVKYYLDTLTLKAMVIGQWTKYYYDRGILPKQALTLAKEYNEALERIYEETDGRVINGYANLALAYAQVGDYKNALKTCGAVESRMRTFSKKALDHPPEFATKFLMKSWEKAISDGKDFHEFKPFDDLNPESAAMIWVILGRIYTDYGKKLAEGKTGKFSSQMHRGKGDKYFYHAHEIAIKLGDKDLRYYVEQERSGKAKKMAAIKQQVA